MKHLKIFAALCCAALLFAACDKTDEPKDPSTEQNGGKVTYTLTVLSSNEEMGTVTGGGSYEEGTEVTITATPNENCYLEGWSDCDSKELVRTIKLTSSDTTFTANFAKKPYLTVNSGNTFYGTVTGSGYYMPGEEVTITAIPTFGFEFVEWNDGNTDNQRIVTMGNADVTYTAIFEVIPMVIAGTENGYDYVDLGLPSGLKWATMNVGADTPEAYGNYYAWGETETKTNYSWDTYKFTTDGGSTFTKYNGTDGKTTLDPEDDAAAVNWGGKWRMPTDAEWTELCTNCTWTWTADHQGTSIAGRIVTGPNGNSIFLPAAGYRFDGSLDDAGNNGGYWSSSLGTDNPRYAWLVYFDSNNVGRDFSDRYGGLSVRPVLF